MVLANLLSAFRTCFTPVDNGEAVERDMRDQLTGNPRDLNLIFQPKWGTNNCKLLDMMVVESQPDSIAPIILVQIQRNLSPYLGERRLAIAHMGYTCVSGKLGLDKHTMCQAAKDLHLA